MDYTGGQFREGNDIGLVHTRIQILLERLFPCKFPELFKSGEVACQISKCSSFLNGHDLNICDYGNARSVNAWLISQFKTC